jgi:hypothetical protein
MDDFQILEKKFPDQNFVEVVGLKRVDWDLFWHPKSDFLKTLEYSGIQVYILEGTIYGCFVNKLSETKTETQWFGHHLSSVKGQEGKYIPDSTIELYRILEVCDPDKVQGLLFHLDVLSDSNE